MSLDATNTSPKCHKCECNIGLVKCGPDEYICMKCHKNIMNASTGRKHKKNKRDHTA